MKICWDNLEGLVYIPDLGGWQDRNKYLYIYNDSCKNCGFPFLYSKPSLGIFCSVSCSSSFNQAGENNGFFGKKHSDVSIQKMKNTRGEGEYHYLFGTTRSAETRAKISKRKKGLFGQLNANWKGDKCITPNVLRIRHSFKYKEWRIAVFERDNYTCQKCGQWGGTLNAHHIESFSNNPELRTEKSNGVTLCEDCHRDFHHIYSRSNNTKEQYNEWQNVR